MAQTIQIKNGTGSSAPATLLQGELAINVSSGSLWYGSGSGNATHSNWCFGEITASNKIRNHLGNNTGTGNITASGTLFGAGLDINGVQGARVHVGTSPIGYDFADIGGLRITGSGLIVSGTMPDANHHNFVKIGTVEFVNIDNAVSDNEFLIKNTNSFIVASGSDGGEIANGTNNMFRHEGNAFYISKNGEALASSTITSTGTTTTIKDTTIQLNATSTQLKALNQTNLGASSHIIVTENNPHTVPSTLQSIALTDIYTQLSGSVTASAVSSSGVGTFASLDISGNIDVDGTTNLDDVDIDGNVDLDGNLTIGENSSGHTLQVFGASTGVNIGFNVSNNDMLKLGDNTILGVGGGNAAATSDLELVHNGTDNIIHSRNGRLVITSSTAFDIKADSGITASGDISASGTITADKLTVDGLGPVYNNQGRFRFGQTLVPIHTSHITSSGEISASGAIYSAAKQYWSTTGRLVVGNNTTNYYGPNNQGVNYYYWNRDLGTSATTITSKTTTLNSGFKLPYKAILTGYHLNIQGRTSNDDIEFTLVYCDGMYDGNVTSTSQTLVAAESGQTVTITTANNFYELDRRNQFEVAVNPMTMLYPRFRKTSTSAGTTNYDFQLAVEYIVVK